MLPLWNHAPNLFFLLANLKLFYWHYIYLIAVLLYCAFAIYFCCKSEGLWRLPARYCCGETPDLALKNLPNADWSEKCN